MDQYPQDRAVGRRGFLGGLAVAAAGAATAVGTVRAADAASPAPSPASTSYPFHGGHQQGILTPLQSFASFLSFDVTAPARAGLTELFTELTSQARFLTTGGAPECVGIGDAPADNGVLGPIVPADGLTVTLSVGASLFDGRFGLASRKPAKLATMSDAPFANDALQDARCDGDLLLQLRADHADTVLHAMRQIMRATRGGMQLRWRRDGFVSPPRPSGTPRNLMGFKDGTANPDVADAKLMDQLVWTHGGAGGEPSWTEGGSYQAVRIIRMLVEFWDRVNLREQEDLIGRRKDSGAPNTGTREFDAPAYVSDPSGESIPLTAHIRLANPRTPATGASRMLRRSYNYDAETDPNGQLDMGLVFVAFNQDLQRQFITVQKRLADEPLTDYISPIGGGYFFALPGVRDTADWYGRALLS